MIPLGMFAASSGGPLLVDEGFGLDQTTLHTVGPGNIPWESLDGWSVSGGALCAPGASSLGGIVVPSSRRTIQDGGAWKIEVDLLTPDYNPRLAVGASLPGYPNDGVDVVLVASSLAGYYAPSLRAWASGAGVFGTPTGMDALPPSRMALEVFWRDSSGLPSDTISYLANVLYGDSVTVSFGGRATDTPTFNFASFGTFIGLASDAPAGTPVFDNLKIWAD